MDGFAEGCIFGDMKLRTAFPVGSVLFRGGLAILAMLIMYRELGPVNNVETETINMLLYGIFLPAYLFTQTIFFALLLGTPIRAIQGVYDWWVKRPYAALLLLAAGIMCCVLSVQDDFAQQVPVAKDIGETFTEPDYRLLYTGWFTTVFALLHFYPESLARLWKGKGWLSW